MVVGLPDAPMLCMILCSGLVAAYIGSYYHLHRRHRKHLLDSVWFTGGHSAFKFVRSAYVLPFKFNNLECRPSNAKCPKSNSTIWSADRQRQAEVMIPPYIDVVVLVMICANTHSLLFIVRTVQAHDLHCKPSDSLSWNVTRYHTGLHFRLSCRP